MRILRIGLLVGCCAGLAACTANAQKGPAATVTVPSVGKPAAPAAAQAALSSEAFTPYAGLGVVAADGLAPGDTYDAMHTACMNAAGYGQYASSAPYGFRQNTGLTFAPPFGPWGYLGTALAAEDGFEAGSPGAGLSAPSSSSGSSAGEQAAAGKCANIIMDFNNVQFAGSMAGIESLNNLISDDVFHDVTIKKATAAWSACMARNGYTASDPNSMAQQEQTNLGLRIIGPGSGHSAPTAAQNAAQTALAVADADCTNAADLAGIYFAVQASFEQQLVGANQVALNAEIGQYKAAFAKELRKLPALLRTVSATPNFGGCVPSSKPGPGKPGRCPRKAVKSKSG